MRGLIRQLLPALLAVVVFTVLCGLIYPLVVTGISQVAFHDKANGSLVKVDGVVVGSSLIGQQFTDPKYFHPRPSAAGSGYDGLASSFSNLGPTNPDFLKSIEERVAAYRAGERPRRGRRRCPWTPSPPRGRASTRTSPWPTPSCRPRGRRRARD